LNKNIHIVSLGCPKNLVDSEVMAALLQEGGYHILSRPDDADIIIVNTCTFILPAKEEAIEVIFAMASLKERGRCRHLVVTGCLPQRYGSALEKEMPEVDLFLGINEVPHIVRHIANLEPAGAPASRSVVEKPAFLMNASHPRLLSVPGHRSYLKIAEGCSNHCSYCVVPLVRGPFRSRHPADILAEAETLAARGVKEIILTAQETTGYGRDLKEKTSLAALMRDMASVSGIRWIRLLYTHPASMTDEVFRAMAETEKVCPYLDLPVQHIDDAILKSMNRKVDSARIRKLLHNARAAIPGLALRTSLIVGFPGEGEAEFNRLLDFVQEARFDHLGAFTYSREEGTVADRLSRHVSDAVKETRRNAVMEAQSHISQEINQGLVGREDEIVLEEASDISGYTHIGRLRRQAPDIDGITYMNAPGREVGDILRCRIVNADIYDLYAEEIV